MNKWTVKRKKHELYSYYAMIFTLLPQGFNVQHEVADTCERGEKLMPGLNWQKCGASLYFTLFSQNSIYVFHIILIKEI